MKTPLRLLIVAALAALVIGAIALKNGRAPAVSKAARSPAAAATAAAESTGAGAGPVAATKLPRLLDLGAGKCIPCKMMVPVLDELRKDYAGRLTVEFIDVWLDPDAGKAFGVEVIPTQIFYDAEGRELFRHVGFFAKADILAQWKKLGVDLK